jgi:putative peptidoglycan lipid II flippase
MAGSRPLPVMATAIPDAGGRGGTRRAAGLLALLATALPVLVLSQGFILEKALDLALEMRLAAMWGTSDRRDMYLLASSVLVPASMLELAAIPLIVDLRRRGAVAEERNLAASMATATLLFTALTVGVALVVWRSSGAATPAAEMLAATAAFGAAGVSMAFLSIKAAHHIAGGRFAFVSARVPIIRAAMIGGVIALPLGIAAPALAAVAASAALAVAVGLQSDVFHWWRPDLRGLGVAAGLLALNAYPVLPRLLIERPLLGAMGDGTLATLDYAEKTTVIAGLAGFAIVGVASTVLHGERWTYRRRALLVAALLAPVAVAVAVLAPTIVSLLFERGEFNAADSQAVAELTRLLAPSIPFVAAVPLLVPGIRGATARRGIALIAAALMLHLLVTAYTYRTADTRALAVAFDVAYAAIFVGFYALAKPASAERP